MSGGGKDVSACGGTTVDGKGEVVDGDCGAGGGASRKGGADWAV